MKIRTIYFILFIIVSNGCQDEISVEDINLKSGGDTTITSSGTDAFTYPLANLDAAGLQKHLAADAAFGQTFVTAPSSQAGGLGPLFNQNSCESCHIRNGRGIVPAYSEDGQSGLLLRLSTGIIDGKPIAVPGYGTQLNTKAIFGVQAEGKLSKTEISEIVKYFDGEEVELIKPVYSIKTPYKALPLDVLLSPRNPSPVFGLGLLEAISHQDIINQADPEDANEDGISGKISLVYDLQTMQKTLGKFGWKAEQPTALQQTADAALNDMGLTNPLFQEEQCLGQDNCINGLQNNLDINEETLDLLTFYFVTLAVPARRLPNTSIQRGEKIFVNLKCSTCHTPKYMTGNHELKQLSKQVIFPYSDLLLHDMGEGLADLRPVNNANGYEWRTPPLWGIGLTQIVNPKATFLHDGRAKTIEEAILWHDGEAKKSKEGFKKLSKEDRKSLLDFINSL